MKKLLTIFACIAALSVLLNVPCASAQGKLEGTWKYIEFVPPGPNAKPVPAESGLLIFTQKHFGMIFVTGDKPRAALPQKGATDAQLAAAWGPLTASGGSYEVKGNTFTAKSLVSKDPGGTGPDAWITVEFKIEGNTLITTPKAVKSGPINLGYAKLVRVE
jgi:hypothetical protein